MPSKRTYHSRGVAAEKMPCKYCNKEYAPRGLKSHEHSCASRRQKKVKEKEFSELVAAHVVGARLKGMLISIICDSERNYNWRMSTS